MSRYAFENAIRGVYSAIQARVALQEQVIERHMPGLGKLLAAIEYHPDHRTGWRAFKSAARSALERWQLHRLTVQHAERLARKEK